MFCCRMIVALLLLVSMPALAGPGGRIASDAFESPAGRVALFFLLVLFAPLIIWRLFREYRAELKARRRLRKAAAEHSAFEWLQIRQRAQDAFKRVHSGWEDEDLSQVSAWMTDWYWQNQQQTYLERWQREGLENVCWVRSLGRIKPILFAHRNDGAPHEGSMVVLSMTAEMLDYLRRRSDDKTVEGSRRIKNVERLWTFVLEDGQWKVANIEENEVMIDYLRLIKELPSIEDTLAASRR